MGVTAQPSEHDLAVLNRAQARWRRMAGVPDEAPATLHLGSIEVVRPGASFHPGGAAPAPRVVTAGWACRRIGLPDGRRQILDFVLPGDVLPWSDRPLNQVQAEAITYVRVADLNDPSLSQALAGVAAEQESRLLDQIVRLGRHTAYERTVHLLLEFYRRLSLVGLAENGAFAFPLTQATLAEALGLSIVHVNRTLQQLREEQMIELRRGSLALLQTERLQANPVFQAALQAQG